MAFDLIFAVCRLNDHIQNVHCEKLYKCTICRKANAQFATMEKLKIHTDKHLIEKKVFPCNLCPKVFQSAANLQKHLLKCENETTILRNIEISNTTTSTEYNPLNLSQSIFQRFGVPNGFYAHTTT